MYLEHGDGTVGQTTEETIFSSVVVVVIEESDAEHRLLQTHAPLLRAAAKSVTVSNNGYEPKHMQVSGYGVKRRL